MPTEPTADEIWRMLLSGQFSWEKDRRWYRLFPARHRCKNCNAPFDGIGTLVARWAGRGKYKRNPRFCNF
jgi:hypothetical protein